MVTKRPRTRDQFKWRHAFAFAKRRTSYQVTILIAEAFASATTTAAMAGLQRRPSRPGRRRELAAAVASESIECLNWEDRLDDLLLGCSRQLRLPEYGSGTINFGASSKGRRLSAMWLGKRLRALILGAAVGCSLMGIFRWAGSRTIIVASSSFKS